jgi:crossover junction endodeoxyribonuclease RuvC
MWIEYQKKMNLLMIVKIYKGVEMEQETLFVGIDPSLTNTAVIILNQEEKIYNHKLIKTDAGAFETTEERLLHIVNEVKYVANLPRLEKVYIEGLSFGSKGQAMMQLAALHFLIRCYFFQRGSVYDVVPPTTVKKFVTGKGNSKKELMLLKTFKRWGVEFEDNNLCDAYCIAQYTLNEYNEKIKPKFK